MNKKYVLNTLLSCVLGVVLLVYVLVRAFAPRIILPEFGVTELVLISLITLVLEHYLAPGAERCYICIPVFSALTFGLLSFGAYLGIATALRLAVMFKKRIRKDKASIMAPQNSTWGMLFVGAILSTKCSRM